MTVDHLALALTVPGLIAIGLTIELARHRKQSLDQRGNLLLMLVVLGLAANALSYGVEIRRPSLEAKLPWLYVRYLGSMLYMLAMLLFTMWCTGRERWLKPRRIALVGLPLVLGIAALMTNDLHHLYYPRLWLDGSLEVPQLRHTVGPLYYVFYLYVMSLAFYGLVRLTEARLSAPQAYKPGLTLILSGSLISLIGFIFYLSGYRLCGVLNATSYFMMLNAILLVVGVLRCNLMAVMPITLQTLIQKLDLGLMVLDRHLRVIEFNQAATRLLELPASGLTGRRLTELMDADDEVLAHCRALSQLPRRFKRGSRSLELGLKNLEGPEQEFQGLMLSVYDISPLKALEESLREAEARSRLILENSPDLIWQISPTGEFTYLSPAWQRVMGYRLSALLGAPYKALVHAEDLPPLEAYLQQLTAGMETPGVPEFRSRRADGQYRWHASKALAVFDENGQLMSLVGISRDIHEQKLEHAEKEKLLSELQQALNEIRTLRGIVPICANCKQIRDDAGYWHQVEKYVQQHSHAQFSHSLCPDCIRQLYPELPRNHKNDQ